MSENSKIEWTEATWNPILGCDKVSAGCKNCYAIKTAWRLQHNPNPKVAKAFEGLTVIQGGQPNWTGRVNFLPERLKEPLGWRKPRRIFVNSQSDLFHDRISEEEINKVFAVMALSRQHTYQVLTKRPDRMQYELWRMSKNIAPLEDAARDLGYTFKFTSPLDGKELSTLPWPIPNIWLGVSCENQVAKERIDILRDTPAAVRMLSLEPLLEDLGTINLEGIQWVIVGGESGPNARPMHPDWARNLRDQCQVAGVPFFFKQWGVWVSPDQFSSDGWDDIAMNDSGMTVYPDGRACSAYGTTADGSERMWRVGKKAAGRKLDGKEHSEYPSRERRASQ